MTTPTALTSDQLVPGLTIASVEQTEVHGRDTFKDMVSATRVTITFTDGSAFTCALSDTDVYDEHTIVGELDESGHCDEC